MYNYKKGSKSLFSLHGISPGLAVFIGLRHEFILKIDDSFLLF